MNSRNAGMKAFSPPANLCRNCLSVIHSPRRYEEIKSTAPPKVKGKTNRSELWDEREERYAQAVKLLQQAEQKHVEPKK